METRRELRTGEAEAYLDLLFRRELLRQLTPKKRMRVLKGLADGVRSDIVVPIGHTPANIATLRRAQELLREQMAFLLDT